MVKAMVDTAHHLHIRGHEASVSSAYIDTYAGMWKGNQSRYATPTNAIVVQGHLSRGGILKGMETDLRALCDVAIPLTSYWRTHD